MKLPKFSQTFLILVIAEIFTSLLIILYFNYSVPKLTNTAPLVSPSPTSLDWKTYKNEQYGYEFRYPNNYSVFDQSLPKLNRIFVGIDIGHPTLIISEPNNYAEFLSRQKTPSNFKIDNIETYIEKGEDYVDYNFVKNGQVYNISIDKSGQYSDNINQILSTFKFTDSSLKSQIENWANYQPDSSINSDVINNPCEGSDIKKVNEIIAKINQTGFKCQTINEVQFCITPNFFNWNTSQFKDLNLGCAAVSLSPFVVVKDMLVWSRFGCTSGFMPDSPDEAKAEQLRIDNCQKTSKEAQLIY